MKELVAVNDAFILMNSSLLKREALMFNRIAIPTLNGILSAPTSDEFHGVRAELAWLRDRDIVFEPEFAAKKKVLNDDYRTQLDLMRRAGKDLINQLFGLDIDELEAARLDKSKVPEVKKKLNKLETMSIDDLRANLDSNENKLIESAMAMSGSLVRIMSIELRELMDLEAFPILSRRIGKAVNHEAINGDVLEIVLKALPVPDDSTAWEQILEFRSDPNSRSKFLALKNWMNKIARAEFSAAEVEDELEYLIDQYEQQMRLHRMKTGTDLFETVIVTGAGIIENLAKLNLSKLAKDVFSVRHRKIALLEQELATPGREVAYVVSAREQFA